MAKEKLYRVTAEKTVDMVRLYRATSKEKAKQMMRENVPAIEAYENEQRPTRINASIICNCDKCCKQIFDGFLSKGKRFCWDCWKELFDQGLV
jgi:hypothetical protein